MKLTDLILLEGVSLDDVAKKHNLKKVALPRFHDAKDIKRYALQSPKGKTVIEIQVAPKDSHYADPKGPIEVRHDRKLNEAADATSEGSKAIKEAKPSLNKIAMMLFGRKCEPVVDEKRSKEAKYFGVSNGRSKLTDAKGKAIRLTFDNSTDSGEFEINSLTPLKIEQGGDLDKSIKSLYKKHKVHSKKKTNYLDVDGDMVLREIHLGSSPDEAAVKLVRDVIKLIRGESVEDKEEKEPTEEKPKKEEAEE